MNTTAELVQSTWLNALGYTLLHSLWQGGVILALVVTILRFTSSRLSNVRYMIAGFGLVLMIAVSVTTFFFITTGTSLPVAAEPISINNISAENLSFKNFTVAVSTLDAIKNYIHVAIPFFLILWFGGTLIFCLRVLTGLFYIGQLRRQAMTIEGEWNQQLRHLSHRLHIEQWVSLASSDRIEAPIVVGFLKPMILIPAGMLTSLSTEQLETIFIHELMHIKRKDFLINLLQSLVEAVFFFNPFVWIFSNIIKREREHCCDDAVVKLHGNPIAYAHALTSLEEVRLSKVGLSVSLAESKNQLLNRITRLMEKSVKKYSGRERIIPALLLVIGLVCASWISTQTGRKEFAFNQSSDEQVLQDTVKKTKKVKKEKKNTALQSAKEKTESNSNTNNNTNRHEDDVTQYNGPVPTEDFDLLIPPVRVPDVEVMIPPFPPMGEMDVVAPMEWANHSDWEEFGKEFGERFKEQFGDFYEKHGQDIEKMIQDIQEDVSTRFDGDWEDKMQDFAVKQQQWAELHAERWEKQAEKLSRHGELMSQRFSEDAKKWEEKDSQHREEFEKNRKEFEKRMKFFEEKGKLFEEKMKEELIKDGYLDQDEKLTNMHWRNGSIEINGKKIKPEHEEKYNAIHKKYFEEKADE